MEILKDRRFWAVLIPLIITLIISISLFFLIYHVLNIEIKRCLSELYIVYIISGFTAIWLIILAVLRYSLSKRHNL